MSEIQKDIPDFREIFYRTLEITPPFARTLAKEYSFREIGITQINKLIPALIFTSKDVLTDFFDISDLNLWLINPNGTASEPYPHLLMDDELEEVLKNYNRRAISRFRGTIIQDDFGKIYFWPKTETLAQVVITESNADIDSDDDLSLSHKKRWIKLIEKYALEKIISPKGNGEIILERHLIDLIDRKTEDEYLFNFARKYGMTHFQYLRFRCLIDSAKEGLISTNFERVAQEVIEFDRS